jgi:hypothetical protein
MPVEASDIVPRTINTGDSSYTGCEEAGRISDDGVRKKPVCTRVASLYNQIHNAEETYQRKRWKIEPAVEFSLQTRPDYTYAFSATEQLLIWKT